VSAQRRAAGVAKERAILRQRYTTAARQARRAGAFFALLLSAISLAGPQRPALAQQPARRAAQPAVRLTPPVPIQGLDTGPSTPLDFSRAWLAKAERVRQRRSELIASGQLDGVAPDSLARLGAALAGRLRIPVIPVHYSNVTPPFPHTILQDRIFGPARGDSTSLAAYWAEVSGGLLTVEGGVTPWVRLKREGSFYLRKEEYGWASFGRAHDLVRDALRGADKLIDFNGFDNDGPDGIPNSGDDDGFADLVIILYAVPCRGEWREGSIWPHRGAIPPFATSARSANGGRIKVADYLILPVQEPGTCDPLHVGTLAHETGHALGLPDLYDYEGAAAGAGAWDLMGTGSQTAPHSPAHLGAWSKEQLGWVRVEWLKSPRQELRIPPVASERTIYRYDLPGRRGEYLLFENRQRIGSDRYLPGTGLLVWKADPDRAALGAWNGIGRYHGVELVRAGRGTPATDPFPGAARRASFELGKPTTIRLSGIREDANGHITTDVAAGYTAPTLLATPLRLAVFPGDSALTRNIIIQREGGAADDWTPRHTATWASVRRVGNLLQVTANPEGLEAGIYTDTIHLLLPEHASTADIELNASLDDAPATTDDATSPPPPGAATDRGPTTGTEEDMPRAPEPASPPAPNPPATVTATPRKRTPATRSAGTLIVQLEVADPAARSTIIGSELPWGWGLAVHHGRLLQASFGRDALSLRPRPRLLRISGTGASPETLARIPADAAYAPVAGPHGSTYILGQIGSENRLFRVDENGNTTTIATLPGSAPAYGAAAFPDGRILVADWNGHVRQVTPDGRVSSWTNLRTNIYQIALDPAGNLFAAAYNGNILRFDPDGKLTTIPTGFGSGRVVAITAAPDGSIFTAERGGAGRILRIAPNGTRLEVARVPGAEFYGLTADDRFLYALDLANRHILRFPLTTLTTPSPRTGTAGAASGSDEQEERHESETTPR